MSVRRLRQEYTDLIVAAAATEHDRCIEVTARDGATGAVLWQTVTHDTG